VYKEIQCGEVAKSYTVCMKKGFLIYEEMRKYFPKYEEAVSHILLCNCSTLNFLINEENLIFFFISAVSSLGWTNGFFTGCIDPFGHKLNLEEIIHIDDEKILNGFHI
jgi:hypothetical protein